MKQRIAIIGLLMALWLGFAGRARAACWGDIFCGKAGEKCQCPDKKTECKRGEDCKDGGTCTDCWFSPTDVVWVNCYESKNGVCTFQCPGETSRLGGGCGISIGGGNSSECYRSIPANGCIGWCPEGTVCRVKKSEPWRCTCGKKAEGLTCPEGTYESCGWSCKKNCRNKGDGSCTKKNGTKGTLCHECVCLGTECVRTAPSNLEAVSLSAEQAQITWTPGTGATSQNLFLDESAAAVEGLCNDGCRLIVQNMEPTVSSYITEPVLEPGKTYYYKIMSLEIYEDNLRECSPRSASASFEHWPLLDRPWWQAAAGNIHAEGTVSNHLPAASYLIASDLWGTGGMVSYGGALDLGAGRISENGLNWRANTSYRGLKTGYGYFRRILQDDPEGIGVWNGEKPEESGIYQGANLGQTSGADWKVAAGEKIVILHEGDLVINQNIEVDRGGFLAIIVSGDITIADGVTEVQGVYVADGKLFTCHSLSCGDSGGLGVENYQLKAEGIFTAWEGVELRRDFNSADNNLHPAELFVYRPDLVVNAHKYLLRPYIDWQEVAP